MSLKHIDGFIQQFVQRCIQVIVQARQGSERTRTKTECKPTATSWFNLDIKECEDVVREETVKCLRSICVNQNMLFIKKNWRICCEISLRNTDGLLVLEYWFFTNTVLNSTQESLEQKQAYQIINRMSSVLKSLIGLTRATPAYRLSSRGQSADSYVICYRIFPCDEDFVSEIMDLVNKNDQFSHAKSLGSIKSVCNELSISLVYRTSMNINSESFLPDVSKSEDVLQDEANLLLPVKDDHFKSETCDKLDMNEIFKPLNPAFATKQNDTVDTFSTTPFIDLLPRNGESFASVGDTKETLNRLKSEKSTPISIPSEGLPKSISKSPQIYSTSNDSYVFVDLNAPFATDDREFGPFFNGPSPTFATNSDDSSDDVSDLCQQLEELKTNKEQLECFVDSICENENENRSIELKFEN